MLPFYELTENNGYNPSDAFTRQRVEPSASIPGEVLLFDNYGTLNPLQSFVSEGLKLRHMTVFFLMRGKAVFDINGDEVSMTGGQTLTTLPNTRLTLRTASEDIKYLLVVIYPELLRKAYEDIYLNYDMTTFSKGYLLGSCNEEQMSIYQIIYVELKKECLRPDYEFKMTAVRNYLNALLINNMYLYDTSDSVDIDPNSRQYDVYQGFLDALNTYSKTERTVKFYADQLGITPKYLSFVCLQYSQKNASQWIGEYVAYNARTLMGIHHLSAAETSVQLNFPNLNSFNRFFKRVSGQTPKEYIKSVKNQ